MDQDILKQAEAALASMAGLVDLSKIQNQNQEQIKKALELFGQAGSADEYAAGMKEILEEIKTNSKLDDVPMAVLSFVCDKDYANKIEANFTAINEADGVFFPRIPDQGSGDFWLKRADQGQAVGQVLDIAGHGASAFWGKVLFYRWLELYQKGKAAGAKAGHDLFYDADQFLSSLPLFNLRADLLEARVYLENNKKFLETEFIGNNGLMYYSPQENLVYLKYAKNSGKENEFIKIIELEPKGAFAMGISSGTDALGVGQPGLAINKLEIPVDVQAYLFSDGADDAILDDKIRLFDVISEFLASHPNATAQEFSARLVEFFQKAKKRDDLTFLSL